MSNAASPPLFFSKPNGSVKYNLGRDVCMELKSKLRCASTAPFLAKMMTSPLHSSLSLHAEELCGCHRVDGSILDGGHAHVQSELQCDSCVDLADPRPRAV